jgi:DNA-binding response OmpR family regulator
VTARVLVVEDDRIFRVPLRAALVMTGYDVLVAESAEAAEQVLAREPVDVVLSDVGLPGMDGVRLAAGHPGTPFVQMTGAPSDQLPRATLPPGVTACLVKPFDVPHLLAALREAMNVRGAIREAIRPWPASSIEPPRAARRVRG